VDAINSLMGNSVPSAILTLGELTALRQDGKARIFATFGSARSPQLPDVPTMAELGYPSLQATGTVVMFAPSDTDPAAIERISRAVLQAIEAHDVKSKLIQMNVEPKGSTPQELDAINRAEFTRWEAPAKASGYVGD
jgi:tripartite-type tricarboxylate transporter receptor subunit TctC